MCCNASFIQSPGSLLFDGIFEMFSKSSYVAWAAEAKNGGLSSTVAGRKWDAAFNKEGAITDKLGETKEEMNRVAMKVADRITLRDAHIRARGYTVSTPHERSGYATLSSPRPNEVGMAEWRADSPIDLWQQLWFLALRFLSMSISIHAGVFPAHVGQCRLCPHCRGSCCSQPLTYHGAGVS